MRRPLPLTVFDPTDIISPTRRTFILRGFIINCQDFYSKPISTIYHCLLSLGSNICSQSAFHSLKQIPLPNFLQEDYPSSEVSFICICLFFFWTLARWQCQTFHKDGQCDLWFWMSSRNPISVKCRYLLPALKPMAGVHFHTPRQFTYAAHLYTNKGWNHRHRHDSR